MSVANGPPKPKMSLGWWARAGFLTVLPAFGVGGAMGIPVLMSVTGALSFRPSLLQRKMPAWVWLLLACLAWTVLSSLWSPYPNHVQALKTVLTLVPGLAFAVAAMGDPASRRLTLAGGAAAFAVLAVLLAVETIYGMPFNRAASPPDAPLGDVARDPARGIVLLVMLSWGVAGGFVAQGRRLVGLAVLAAAAALSTQFDQQATLLAFLAGLAAFGLGAAAPAVSIRALTVGVAAWLLAAPWLTPLVVSNPQLVSRLPESWAQRVGIWDYACARIAEQPWIGHGIDASRAVTERINVRGVEIRGIASHPHSASLHLWFDTGLVGAALAAAALVIGGWTLSRALAHNRAAAAAACGVIASVGIIANLSYSVWAEWQMSAALLAAALVGAIRGAKA